ncbi:MAG TPA: sugar ABC transporter ATP-binding protein [Planctomycetota bacterium]|nr:sugar ABC transporter ATP-binding protein [Planctomycetota bacterium]
MSILLVAAGSRDAGFEFRRGREERYHPRAIAIQGKREVMPLVELRSLRKSFAGVKALGPTSLEVGAGECLGLVGENGAGKSTLIKLLAGVHRPDGGEIVWKGLPVELHSPRDAMEAGIAVIHQELECFGRLTVAENLLLGGPWPRYRWGGVDWRRLEEEARRRLDRFGLEIPASAFLGGLSAAEKQEVAIVRALSRRSDLVILDEPTASLSAREVDRLAKHLARLREDGVSVIYISHRLEEVLALTDRVAVLRDGDLVAVHRTRDADTRRLVSDMAGREPAAEARRTRGRPPGAPLLEVVEASRRGMFRSISLEVRAGEVVGLAGLVGAGRSELARAIYGLYRLESGEMRLRGRSWKPRGPAESIRAGLVYVPEERKRQALVLHHSLGDSISIGFSDIISRRGLVSRREESSRLEAAVAAFGIRAPGLSHPVGNLSGGNQQKAVLARWLARDPEVIILDEPTRGVDVASKEEIHSLIDRLAERGKAILLVSSDLGEVLAVCDRVVVLHEGSVSDRLAGSELTRENVLLAASRLRKGAG